MKDYEETYKSVPLMCDSFSAISLTQNSVFHGRVKHIKVRHHFLRDHIEKGDTEMRYIETERQLVDIFTKLFYTVDNPMHCCGISKYLWNQILFRIRDWNRFF
jgi:hypothetical protein